MAESSQGGCQQQAFPQLGNQSEGRVVAAEIEHATQLECWLARGARGPEVRRRHQLLRPSVNAGRQKNYGQQMLAVIRKK